MIDIKKIDVELIKSINNKASNPMDEDETGHYDVLSAFQKSIRGSDVNASLHYLARLIESDDLDIITIIKEQAQKLQSKKVKKFNQSLDLSSLQQSDFSSVYLFFDYDAHQDNFPHNIDRHTVIKEMLMTFNNETENGKLYISYPMVEAIKDFEEINSFPQRNFLLIEDGIRYKNLLSASSSHLDFKNYTKQLWDYLITIYIIKIHYIFNMEIDNNYLLESTKKASTLSIYMNVLKKYDIPFSCIPILSAFPEFILDYFTINFIFENIEIDSHLLNQFQLFKLQCDQDIKNLSISSEIDNSEAGYYNR